MKRYWYIWSFVLGLGGLVAMACADRFSPTAYSPSIHDPDPAVRADAVRNNTFSSDAALHDENADVRILAIWRAHGEYERIVPLLKDEHAGVRKEAAKALSNEKAWPVIQKALADPDPDIRKGAIAAILATRLEAYDWPPWPLKREGEVGSLLLKLAAEDPDAGVRLCAEEAHEDFMGWKR
ncbi:MAG TPA: HEAT repeat domain-containing protein [Gemmataceae bacterium]|jgi:HEAT repeat protein|nr:HEAT repeat domain-containing protein [Gemmataceae bacterium]